MVISVNAFGKDTIYFETVKMKRRKTLAYERIFRQFSHRKLPTDLSVYHTIIRESKTKKVNVKIVEDQEFLEFAMKKSIKLLEKEFYTFEQYLKYCIALQLYKEWYSISIFRQKILMTPMAVNAAKAAIQMEPTNPAHAFMKCSKNFSSLELKKLQYFIVVDPQMQSFINEYKSVFDELQREWINFLHQCLSHFDATRINTMPSPQQYLFWSIIERLKTIGNITQTRQFDLLLESFEKLYIIVKNERLASKAALLFSDSPKLPQIVLLSQEFIVSSPVFRDIFDEKSMKVWNYFVDELESYIKDSVCGSIYNSIKVGQSTNTDQTGKAYLDRKMEKNFSISGFQPSSNITTRETVIIVASIIAAGVVVSSSIYVVSLFTRKIRNARKM